MIVALTFGEAVSFDGRLVRAATFARRSTLPLTAATLVASGVREALSRQLATELDVELVEPVMPALDARRVLFAGATIARVRGRLCDAFVVVRPRDARRLVAAAFGEPERAGADGLSSIERATLERLVGALVPLCTTLCGTLGPVATEPLERTLCDAATYFEVRTIVPPRVAVGFAITADPAETVGERLTLDDLADVELVGSVDVASGHLRVPAFARLRPGERLALDTALGEPGALRFGEVRFGRGTCGVRGGRYALAFEAAA